MQAEAFPRPLVAVSSCLLGQEVRFDGGHKRERWITDVLAGYFDFSPICPEVGIGMGIPRPPIRLVGDESVHRAVGVKDPDFDVTDRLTRFAEKTARQLGQVSGYILKSRSPSCGMERVPLYGPSGHGRKIGVGIHAGVIMRQLPNLPVEEEGRLNDPVLRENFINRVYVYRCWQDLKASRLSASKLVAFHSDHKYMVMAHNQAAYKRLGTLLSQLKGMNINQIGEVYIAELMMALKRRVSRKRHVNALQHILGYLKKQLGGEDRLELAEAIEAYRRGEVPLVVPMFLLRHHFRYHPAPYIERQAYLDPYPASLGLRNNI